MRRMQIIVDGREAFAADVPDTVLPSDGELVKLLPDMLRPQAGQPASTLTRITVLTMLIDMMRQGIEGSPMLKPITVEVNTRGMGHATIEVDMVMADEPVDAEIVDLPDAG